MIQTWDDGESRHAEPASAVLPEACATCGWPHADDCLGPVYSVDVGETMPTDGELRAWLRAGLLDELARVADAEKPDVVLHALEVGCGARGIGATTEELKAARAARVRT